MATEVFSSCRHLVGFFDISGYSHSHSDKFDGRARRLPVSKSRLILYVAWCRERSIVVVLPNLEIIEVMGVIKPNHFIFIVGLSCL